MNKTALDDYLIVKGLTPFAKKEAVILDNNLRITILFPEVIRVERAVNGHFTDDATQIIWHRNMTSPFSYKNEEKEIIINTNATEFHIFKKNKKSDYVILHGKKIPVSNKGNLKGTARTLDQVNGKTRLDDGVISKTGVAYIEDNSLLLLNDGMLHEREIEDDEYIFAFGDRYQDAINAFYALTGEVPLLPRYTLGNWWCRYHPYSEKEYLTLMDRFQKEEIPLSVACVDMDWHYVDVAKLFGVKRDKGDKWWTTPGWTGYTWNKELFPDYRRFLAELKKRNLAVNLNLHPSQGVRFYEEQYELMAESNGINPKTKEKVPFDITSATFINSYFKYLHQPYERDGVDFWWIDWQQGNTSALKGSDPLWSLNHYHYLESKIGPDGKERTGLTMSRYAGLGSHRYPIGFSGDTHVTWKTLDFQPYFTANAANVGYTWWSHDIGGALLGEMSNELYTRWVEFGVFSPNMRLHCCNNLFQGKEPWKYSGCAHIIANEYLKIRHQLIPYLYTMNALTHEKGIAIARPLYYSNPLDDEAYKHPNEYYLGSEMIIAPITSKNDPVSALGKVSVYLPKGRWTDLFNGFIYEGPKTVTMCRTLDKIPVLIKEGGIIPLSLNKGNGVKLPTDLEVLIYRGNNEFTMVEDDDNQDLTHRAFTSFVLTSNNQEIILKMPSVSGNTSLIPNQRNYEFNFKDLVKGTVKAIVDGKVIITNKYDDQVKFSLNLQPASIVEIHITDYETLKNPSFRERAEECLSLIQGKNLPQMIKGFLFLKCKDDQELKKFIESHGFNHTAVIASEELL